MLELIEKTILPSLAKDYNKKCSIEVNYYKNYKDIINAFKLNKFNQSN